MWPEAGKILVPTLPWPAKGSPSSHPFVLKSPSGDCWGLGTRWAPAISLLLWEKNRILSSGDTEGTAKLYRQVAFCSSRTCLSLNIPGNPNPFPKVLSKPALLSNILWHLFYPRSPRCWWLSGPVELTTLSLFPHCYLSFVSLVQWRRRAWESSVHLLPLELAMNLAIELLHKCLPGEKPATSDCGADGDCRQKGHRWSVCPLPVFPQWSRPGQRLWGGTENKAFY